MLFNVSFLIILFVLLTLCGNGFAVDIPIVDISEETERHVFIAKGNEDIYQGHPTTTLMGDGKTMYCVWTHGHGGVCGPMKRSDDGGLNWSELLPVPENWSQVYNCPSIYRISDATGTERLIVLAARTEDQPKNRGNMQQSISEDGGRTWTPYRDLDIKCVMAFCGILPINDGKQHLGVYHPGGCVMQSISDDGGLTWGETREICRVEGTSPCEPALVRSPDGKQILCLMRENKRKLNSLMITSEDEAQTWSEPREVTDDLTGDRHMPKYAPDGRLVIAFRDMAKNSPTKTHFVAWVGTYEDIIKGRPGEYKIKLLHSNASWDCGYPGLELLPDGTFIATTYIKYWPDERKHSVVSTRFKLEQLDRRIK